MIGNRFLTFFLLMILGTSFSACNQGNVKDEALYFSDKNVLDVKLKGLTPVNTPVKSTDSIVTAFSKAQGQLNTKQDFITAGTTTQFLRGDKTWQTLNTTAVTEGTNLYLTTARVLAIPLTGLITTNATPYTSSNTLLEAFGKAQAQLNTKLDTTTFIDWSSSGAQTIEPSRLSLGVANASKLIATDSTGYLVASTVTATENGYLSGVTSAVQTQLDSKQATVGNTLTLPVKSLRIYGANATNYTELTAPSGLASNLNFILPSTAGTPDQVLITDGAGTLSWGSVSALVPVTSVNGSPGAVTLTTTDIAEGTNLYFTDNRVGTAAPTTLLTALPAGTNAAITATDTILNAFANLQRHSTELSSNKIDLTGGTLSSGTLTGVPTPSSNNQAATKQYVDSLITSYTCPTGYILVPKNTTYVAQDFCVMKYEAKDDGYGTAVSTAANTPWVNINRATARGHCQALGAGYDLISNEQWQTIAKNIAGVAANWSNGIVLDSELNRGHSDNSPANTLAASSDDTSGNCSGTGETCDSTTWNSQRRTHTLSNGNVIWDIAGNVWEWMSNDNTATNGANDHMSLISGGDIRQTRYGASAFCTDTANSPYCGMGNGWFTIAAGGAVWRGGSYWYDTDTGIFATGLANAATATGAGLGFRCVFAH